MTPTAKELINNEQFWQDRWRQQIEYMKNLDERYKNGSFSNERYMEVSGSAYEILLIVIMGRFRLPFPLIK